MNKEQISKKQVAKTASLARLALNNKEIDKFAIQLASVLDNFSQIDAVKTKGVNVSAQVTGLEDVMVKDEPKMKIKVSQKDLLSNVPETDQGYIIVPRVL
ncbi:unnamed protein product [marine sediment metagenome]|uniref:Aspartyl/glutamyl-tRNA(Asn/Gln) amidotransferase subunit C n=1 Tax=marine sediment metagenome TaxID=412755 RepID=X1C9C0_9ZZZZ